jgi:hypothetical protein
MGHRSKSSPAQMNTMLPVTMAVSAANDDRSFLVLGIFYAGQVMGIN